MASAFQPRKQRNSLNRGIAQFSARKHGFRIRLGSHFPSFVDSPRPDHHRSFLFLYGHASASRSRTPAMTETLVCLAAEHVASLELPEGFTSLDPSLLDRLLLLERLWLGPRSCLETDERFRQLVSYVVFRHASSVLVYRRASKGGESRLHGLLSLGVGGHVNASDLVTEVGQVDLRATLHRACSREIAEEVRCGGASSLRTIGVIKESATPVSRVHLGVVVECRLERPEVCPLDPGLADARFVSVDELPQLSSQMETWSSALIEPLTRVTG